jgi:hypothetical protein
MRDIRAPKLHSKSDRGPYRRRASKTATAERPSMPTGALPEDFLPDEVQAGEDLIRDDLAQWYAIGLGEGCRMRRRHPGAE